MIATTVAALGLAACGSPTPSAGPGQAASQFLSAWGHGDWAAMRVVVKGPPQDFATINASAFSDLGVISAHMTIGAIAQESGNTTAPVVEHLNLSGVGPVELRTKLSLVQVSGTWRIRWSPTTIYPRFSRGERFVVNTTWPARAVILGARGLPLVAAIPVVEIGVEGSYVKNPTTLTRALVQAGAPAASVKSALAAAKANPTYFEPVFQVSEARYLQLKPTIYPLPGTVFQTVTVRQAISPALDAHIVGSVGPVTAQQLASLGSRYGPSAIVGQTGLEAIDERQLAGTPGYLIAIDDASGGRVDTVTSSPPIPGEPVRTSIDPAVEAAASSALAGETKHAAFVAVRASTGQVLASVSTPSSDGFDQALDGSYPPGSTFKTVTSTALIDSGLSPSSPATCPISITVGGEVFHNAEGDSPVSNLAQAFTESCNTAFIGLATSHLSANSLPAAAAAYGIGTAPEMGIPAFAGEVPTPTDTADLAATAIGQAQVLVSPLDMAMVAAAIDSGVVHSPRLVAGTPDDRAATKRLAPHLIADLHEMMADVVARGTASGQGLPAGTFAKTGTAEYGTGAKLKTDAWLVGFRGDIAFAIVVVDGGFGGPTDGPIAAKFLDAIPATT